MKLSSHGGELSRNGAIVAELPDGSCTGIRVHRPDVLLGTDAPRTATYRGQP
jgi:hypothetical protein